ncbi:MAG TPA: lamin tail domain-containing protein [Candidatus Microsaccharimonas sp.]|jgi:hypothetical protein
MLKVFLGFVVSVVVLLASAYVPLVGQRAYATSANVLITEIQAGAIGAATQEFIVIYNNSPDEVDISGWCLTNKSNATIVCFSAPAYGQALYLPGYKHAVAVSTALSSTLLPGTVAVAYIPTSQSSGSITGSSDTISLIDHTGNLVDRQEWTTSISAGMWFERRYGTAIPVVYQDTDTSADWTVRASGEIPVDETEVDQTIVDVCPNIEGVQTTVPIGKVIGDDGDCMDDVILKLNVTELLPNADGSDEGQEFIELYNPNDQALLLSNYTLYVGPQYEDTYSFPVGVVIQPKSYLSFSNSDMPFTLLNSSSRVRVALKNGVIVSDDVPTYSSPKDGESWALIDGLWQYTHQPTPGYMNVAMGTVAASSAEMATAQPCAANQYRSPETNRCRLLTTLGVAVTPCKDGQYRSEETNRCRNIATDAKTIVPCDEDQERNPETQRCRKIAAAAQPAACKEGQERNLDTNRCRTITKMPTADYAVLGAETKSGGNWYIWAAVGGVLLLALGYAIWEWHEELARFCRRYSLAVLRFARIRK